MILKEGSKGPAVEQLQRKLKAVGHDPGTIDGVYGARTTAAVHAFQEDHHDLDTDGVAGEMTLAALMTDRVTLRKIALLTFPTYTGTKISIDVANHIDRQAEEAAYYIDWLVDLANIVEAGPNHNAASREILPISSGVPILPGQSAQLTARVLISEFRSQRFMISNAGTPGGAADWVVNDLRINNRPVLTDDVPGALFAIDAPPVVFDTTDDTFDVVAIVTYIGVVEAGVPFFGAMTGVRGPASPHYVRVHPPAANVSCPGRTVQHTEIPLGFAYVSFREARDIRDTRDTRHRCSITIYVPAIDEATIAVAIDATLAAGDSTEVVQTMIEHALDVRGAPIRALIRDTYIALVVQRANALVADEAKGR